MLQTLKKPMLALLAAALPLTLLAPFHETQALVIGSSDLSSSSSSQEDWRDDLGWPWTIPEDNDTDKFWADILQKIRTGKEGEVIEADARNTEYIVPRVITETNQYGVVVRVIFRSPSTGEKRTVILSRETVKPVEAGVLYYPWKEFEKLYLPEEKSESLSSSQAPTPQATCPPAGPVAPVSPTPPVPPSPPEPAVPSQTPDPGPITEQDPLPESGTQLPEEAEKDFALPEATPNAPTGMSEGGVLSVGATLSLGGMLSLTVFAVGLLGGRRKSRL